MDTVVILVFVFGTLGALAWALFRMLKPARGKPLVCTACGHAGPTKLKARGSTGLELLLWLCFLLPGLLYSFWRVSTKRQTCQACGGDQLVPLNSPVGRRLAGPVPKMAPKR